MRSCPTSRLNRRTCVPCVVSGIRALHGSCLRVRGRGPECASILLLLLTCNHLVHRSSAPTLVPRRCSSSRRSTGLPALASHRRLLLLFLPPFGLQDAASRVRRSPKPDAGRCLADKGLTVVLTPGCSLIGRRTQRHTHTSSIVICRVWMNALHQSRAALLVSPCGTGRASKAFFFPFQNARWRVSSLDWLAKLLRCQACYNATPPVGITLTEGRGTALPSGRSTV